ncbi:hypothetical protein EG328_009839 [Venturia inaequalis]|uniref:Transmembrane protein n=1 Tax=Venturia inaequalis TaxID=5025 RepID=A0A8H3UAQ6_VENIN|nr:hypothetical protein EG328_009839 [Venturia inaequalis]
MWEKRAFLAYFVALCTAQREAMADLRARQALPSVSGRNQLVDTPVPEFEVLAPREPQITPAASNSTLDVFTTVLYPSVPTAAPTANVVPIVVTYTGTLVPSEVPGGFQWTTTPTSEPGTSAPTSSQNIPNVVNTPTEIEILPAVVVIPSSMTMSTSISTSTPMSIPTSTMISHSFSIANPLNMITSTRSSTSSTTSSISSTPSSSYSSTTSSSSITSVSTTASNTLSAVPTGMGLSKTHDAQETHKLSSGSIAGVVIGAVGGAAIFIALALFLWSRNRRSKQPASPGIYPEEAYLYDPPMTPPRGPTQGVNGGDIGRALSPEGPGAERDSIMTMAAGGIGAAAAAAGGGGDGYEARPPQQWNGYSPVLSQDMTEWNSTTPIAGPSFTHAGPSTGDPFADPRYDFGSAAAAGAGASAAASSNSHWPLNPNADSGLGTPPGSPPRRPSSALNTPPRTASGQPSTRPSTARPSTSLSRGTPSTVAGPSISGVGSQRYYRRVNTPVSPPLDHTAEVVPSPHMRELRRAWGMDS